MPSAALRSPRVWIVSLLCVGFATLTMWTSAQSGLTEDASKGLFGDPLARGDVVAIRFERSHAEGVWIQQGLLLEKVLALPGDSVKILSKYEIPSFHSP